MTKRPILLTTLAFAVLGPLIAALLEISWVGTQLISDGRSAAISDLAEVLPPIVAWSFVLGCVPAALTGLAWGLLVRRLSGVPRSSVFLRGLSGALIGAVISAVVAALWGLRGNLYLLFPIFGAAAAGILACLFPPSHLLHSPSNNRWRGP